MEEGMGRVGYLELIREILRWVVEWGTMAGFRSTRSPMIVSGLD